MKKKILLASLLLLLVATPFIASAGILTGSLKEAVKGSGFQETTDEDTIRTTVGTIIRAFLGLLGTIFLVLLVYAGYLWMTAGGNEEDVTKAKKLIFQAIVGLAIVMGAYAITAFVLLNLKEVITPS